ncbi:MAG: hypothetical protein QM628_05685 [Propionicimonas sp.]
MTTPTQPQTAPSPTGVKPDATLTPAGRASQALTGRGSGATPRRLRLARLVHVLLALVLGLGAVATAVELNEREATAAVHAAQHERATEIEASLQYAQDNAAETPADDAALPEKTRNALDTATTALVEMADAGTDDTAQLAGIAHLISRYAEALAAGQPTAATQLLEDELLPAVRQLQTDHSAVAGTVVAWWMWLVPVGAWLAVATVVGIAWYTARISRRVINPGLLIAAIATVMLAVRSGTVLAGHIADAPTDAGFLVLAVATTLVSAVSGAWGLHQRLKEYR